MAKSYDAADIQVLEGLDAVRMRPGMYIGSTGSRGLHHMLWEIVDNGLDEAANGFATQVRVTLHKDGSATVEDDGRGIPVDEHPTMHISGVEVVYTQLHAGGKFNNENYAYSGGLHGVGASVVNALSAYVDVDVYSDWSHYHIGFRSEFDKAAGKVVAGRVAEPLTKIGNTRKKGTKVTFLPDPTVFEETEFDYKIVSRRLRELAYLNPGIEFVFTDERAEEEKRKRSYLFSGGLSDYALYLTRDKNTLFDKPLYFEAQKDDTQVRIAMIYTDGYTESVFSYVNNIPTGEGGTHETGFKSALTKTGNDYLRKQGVLKDKDQNLSGDDFREGLTAILSIYMKNPQFEGQTKGRLGNTEVRPIIESVVQEQLQLFFEDLRNGTTAQIMMEKAVSAAKVRLAARKAKDLARAKGALDATPLVGKLSASTGRDYARNELFIVEGNSAGGTAKQGRDRRFQAVLPLRGKPLNAEKKRLDQVLANEEFRSVITALGTGIADDFDISSLKYNRVIILSDADQDGAHIRAILLTFFYRYMRELVNSGHIYIGMPPLYKVTRGNKGVYAYDDKELAKVIKSMGKGYTLQRYKGLGEMNPEQLWTTTLDPNTRKLMQVTMEDAAQADELITILMGDKVEPRREYIAQYANFSRADTYMRHVDAAEEQASV